MIMISPVTLGILLIINTALAQHDGCGERIESRTLIIRGEKSKRGMWPWQVGIYKNASNWKFECGGALIAPQWVLTAAHCFYVERENSFKTWLEKDISPVNEYKVRAGDHKTFSYESTEQEGISLEILIHPGYKPNRNHENDIALIKLNRTFTLSRYVRTVCLPGTTEDLAKPGVTGTVAGWGVTESGSLSSILRHSTQSILNNSLCHRGSKHFFNETVTFCAHDTKSMPCYGDSGGSMVREVLVNGQHRWFTIGLVSWGGCTLKSKYGYYTRVQPFMDWILHKTNSTCLDPGLPHNGLRTPAKRIYQHNDEVTFGCKANYTRIGKALLLCQRDGTWNGYKPLCLDPCSDPGVPTHGVRFGNNFKHGQVVMFRCKQGYKLTGKPFIICNEGRWDKTTPNCSSPCSNPGIPFNGKRLDHSFLHNDKVRFSCDAGWKMDGEQTITCKNGRWNHNTPKCLLEANCPDPGVPNGGQRQGAAFTHGSFVNFTCSSVTILIGSPRIKCRNGSWSNGKPVCEAKCKDPGSPPNATRQLGLTKEDRQTLTYSCPSSMAVIGQRVLTCKQGAWSHDLPSCSGCGLPLGMENKKIPDANIKNSSHMDWDHRSKYGRLNHRRAWCSGREWSPYLEIDLGKPYWITHLATQGSERDRRWVKEYVVAHNLARSSFIDYRENHSEKMFMGNKDATSIVKNKLKYPFIARRIRFYPQNDDPVGYYITRACMRVEIYGCDIPNDCVMVGSRVLGKWGRSSNGLDYYYKAYVKSISRNYVQLDLENEDHDDRYFKYSPKTSIVLDVPLKQEELRIGTRVLAPWNEKYYSATITYAVSKRYYYVKQLDKDPYSGNNWFTIDKLRRLKNERFCD